VGVNVGAHPLNVLSICTGGGGLDLGLELAIPCARPVCLVEREAFAVAHLVEAMCAGLLADCPVWTDARTFDGRPWRGVVDCLIGGIPCQPHSLAGRKQGSLDERDLWGPTRRIIVQTRPWVVLIENVAGMLSAGADDISGAERVLRDLRRLGYEVEAGIFSAAEVGAPHQRERLFILAVADPGRSEWRARDEGLFADRHQTGRDEGTGGAQQSGPHVAAASSAGLEGRERRGAFESVNREPTPRPVAELRGASLGHADCLGRGERRAKPEVRSGRDAARWSGAPMENAARSDRSTRDGGQKGAERLSLEGEASAFSLPVPASYPVGGNVSPARRSLNPLFVEWLMGWPPGWTLGVWTDFACSETALCLWRQRMRSALSAMPLPPAPLVQPSLFT
jgi:DNA (cytosine-5)-methyltransferase 1